MIIANYSWHGLVLTDLQRINYPVEVYLLTTSVLEIVLSAIMLAVVIYLPRRIPFVHRILISGALTGLFVFAIAFNFGLSFATEVNLSQLGLDACWQVFEQVLGVGVSGLVMMVRSPQKILQ